MILNLAGEVTEGIQQELVEFQNKKNAKLLLNRIYSSRFIIKKQLLILNFEKSH